MTKAISSRPCLLPLTAFPANGYYSADVYLETTFNADNMQSTDSHPPMVFDTCAVGTAAAIMRIIRHLQIRNVNSFFVTPFKRYFFMGSLSLKLILTLWHLCKVQKFCLVVFVEEKIASCTFLQQFSEVVFYFLFYCT